MEQLKQRARQSLEEINQAADRLDVDNQETELKHLRAKINSPEFWHDNKLAQEISKQEAVLAKRIQPWLDLRRSAWEMTELADLDDTSMEAEIEAGLDDIESKFEELKKRT